MYEALRSGRFVLVTREGAHVTGENAPWEALGHTDVVTPAEPVTAAMLVRPDGYIAWAG